MRPRYAATEAASDRIEAFDLAYCGDSDDETSSPDPGLDGDDLASLFDNPEFQQLMTDAGITLTDEQAACLAENLDDDLLASLAGLLGEDLADIDPQSVTVFLYILVTCEIPLTALATCLSTCGRIDAVPVAVVERVGKALIRGTDPSTQRCDVVHDVPSGE